MFIPGNFIAGARSWGVWRGGQCAHSALDAARSGSGRGNGAVPAMIPIPSGVRVWLATGHTDMRRGMNSLALQVQEGLKRDPHAGDLYVFRGKRGHLIKVLWHDGIGMSLYAKRLERGRFIWPSPADGVVAISSHSWLTCSTASTGAIRYAPGGRRSRAEVCNQLGCGVLTHPTVETRMAIVGMR